MQEPGLSHESRASPGSSTWLRGGCQVAEAAEAEGTRLGMVYLWKHWSVLGCFLSRGAGDPSCILGAVAPAAMSRWAGRVDAS